MLSSKTRRSWLATTSLMAVAISAHQVGAQEANGAASDLGVFVERNSDACGFSFFSDGDDSLDFSDNGVEACFDMLAGDDVLILNRNEFVDGVEVLTGDGRDTAWLAHGPDKITDGDGNDREIRTFGGDDHIIMNLPADRDAFRGVDKTQATDILPGAGTNMIRIGENIPTNAVARVSPNARLWPIEGADDDVNITCGRPWIADVIDLQVPSAPKGTRVDIDSDGCGVALESLYGEMTLKQVGGRLVIDTDRAVSRFEEQHGQMLLKGDVEAGTGLFMEITRSAPATNFNWEGSGVAMLSLDLEDRNQGGSFVIASTSQVVYERSGSGQATVDLTSEAGISVRYFSTEPVAEDVLSLSAPNATILWEWGGEMTFPKVIAQDEKRQQWSSIKIPDNPFVSNNVGKVQSYADEFHAPQGEVSPIVPVHEVSSVSGLPSSLRIEKREAVIPSTNVDLEMDLRAARDQGCFNVKLNGLDKVYTCAEEDIQIDDTSGMVSIILEHAGEKMEIDTNGESEFAVSSLLVRM